MPDFKVAAAQVASVRGDIDGNIATHAAAIRAAAEHQVSVLVFPELSLTGYEPELAADLAITDADLRLAPLRALAQHHRMEIVAGAPLRNGAGKPALGALVIAANGGISTYRKMHLGTTERPYFAAGDVPLTLTTSGQTVGLAICADSSHVSHPQAYADRGAGVYAIGVFMNAEWYATDVPRHAAHAARFGMLVVMANHAASAGTYMSVGKSAIWSPDGSVLVQAEGTESALLIATHREGVWHGEAVNLAMAIE